MIDELAELILVGERAAGPLMTRRLRPDLGSRPNKRVGLRRKTAQVGVTTLRPRGSGL